MYPVKITAKVEKYVESKLNILDTKDKINILNTTVKAAGIALFIIFIKKLPLILSLFGSKANTKDGIPIVKTFIRVICIGSKGYLKFKNINIIDNKKE